MKVSFDRIIIKNDYGWALNLITNLVQCKICFNIMLDPYDCICCNETFCKQCIIDYLLTNKKCPFANDTLVHTTDNEDANGMNEDDYVNKLIADLRSSNSNTNKLIASLKFACCNKINGCNAELSFSEFDDHLIQCKFKSIENLTGLDQQVQNDNKDKFKFQDSCMSFQKIEISDTNNYNCTPQQFNQRVMEKLDHMLELITCISSEPKQLIHSPNDTNSNFYSNQTNKQCLYGRIPDSTDMNCKKRRGETPKFKSRQPERQISNKSTIEILSSKIEGLAKKITSIERTIQTVSSLNTQEYLIKDNHYIKTTKTNKQSSSWGNIIPSKPSTSNYPSTNSNHINITNKNTSSNCNSEQINTTSSNVDNNNLNELPLTVKDECLDKSTRPSMAKLNSSKRNTKLIKMNTIGNRSAYYQHNHSMNKADFEKIKVKEAKVIYFNDFEALIDNKDHSIRKFIEEKVISRIIDHFDDKSLISNNIFESKLREIKELFDTSKGHLVDNEAKKELSVDC